MLCDLPLQTAIDCSYQSKRYGKNQESLEIILVQPPHNFVDV
jgi:hypothetical protein